MLSVLEPIAYRSSIFGSGSVKYGGCWKQRHLVSVLKHEWSYVVTRWRLQFVHAFPFTRIIAVVIFHLHHSLLVIDEKISMVVLLYKLVQCFNRPVRIDRKFG